MNDLGPLFSEALKAISDWKVAGALASLAILVGLLVRLSKTALGQSLLRLAKLDGPSKRPWVAAILGALGASSAVLAGHGPWVAVLTALVTGGLAGWAATGANEARPSSHDGRAILSELQPLNASEVAGLKADYAAAKAFDAAPARLKAKAELLDRLLR